MALTDNQRIQIANKHRATKIKLEAAFIAVLLRLLVKIAKRLVSEYKDGKTLSASTFESEFFEAVRNQYIRANKRIDSRYINASQSESIKDVNNIAFNNFNTAIGWVLTSRIAAIMATTQKDINDSIAKLIGSKSPDDIAQLRHIFMQKSAYRASLIGITETNNAVEAKKLVLAETYLQKEDHLLKKTWVTILDGKERKWHGDVFGASIFINDLFDVADESLSHPGDMTHGATAKNICNCRCSCIYEDGRIVVSPFAAFKASSIKTGKSRITAAPFAA